MRNTARLLACTAALAGSFVGLSITPSLAADQPAAPAVALELNKLEPTDKGCRAYMVVNNPTDTVYQTYKLDLVLFQADGVIGRRVELPATTDDDVALECETFQVSGDSFG